MTFALSKESERLIARQANSIRFLAGPVVGQRASMKTKARTGRANGAALSFFVNRRLVLKIKVSSRTPAKQCPLSWSL